MLKIIQHFGKHCSCHIWGEYVIVEHFWKTYIGRAVGAKLDLMVLIGGVEERAAIQLEMSTWLRKIGDEKLLTEEFSATMGRGEEVIVLFFLSFTTRFGERKEYMQHNRYTHETVICNQKSLQSCKVCLTVECRQYQQFSLALDAISKYTSVTKLNTHSSESPFVLPFSQSMYC
jgi:hypothetical protein